MFGRETPNEMLKLAGKAAFVVSPGHAERSVVARVDGQNRSSK
jgi:hypothetical protein